MWQAGATLIAVHGPLTIAASLVVGHMLQTRRLSNCGSRAQLLRGMWDLPRPGLEPVSPAFAGRLSTTAPPGKPGTFVFNIFIYFYFWLHWVFVAARGLFSSCGKQGLLFLAVRGLLIGWLLLLQSTGSRRAGFSSCGTRAQ